MSIDDEIDDEIDALVDELLASPAGSGASPAAPQLGWGPDGKFRATRDQQRDPAWCRKHNADRARAFREGAFILLD